MTSLMAKPAEVVTFNAGGTLHQTLLQTLRGSTLAFPDSTFAVLFGGDEWRQQCDANGAYFVDRDGELFRAVLQVLRHPQLARLVPKVSSRELWQAELEFWGLVPPVLQKRARTPTQEDSLVLMGRAIRRRLLVNEAVAVRTLLEKSGYSTDVAVTRRTTLYVPVGRCQLVWGQDLGHFMLQAESQRALTRLLQEVLAPCHVKAVGLYRQPTPLVYRFDGQRYDTAAQETVQVEIELDSDDDEDGDENTQ